MCSLSNIKQPILQFLCLLNLGKHKKSAIFLSVQVSINASIKTYLSATSRFFFFSEMLGVN